jgi:hypothetical protein
VLSLLHGRQRRLLPLTLSVGEPPEAKVTLDLICP